MLDNNFTSKWTELTIPMWTRGRNEGRTDAEKKGNEILLLRIDPRSHVGSLMHLLTYYRIKSLPLSL